MRKQDGISLIEVLIVVAIVGIIAAIAIPSLLNARHTARFGEVNERAEKYLGLRLNDKVIDVNKPYERWFSEDEKAIARPWLATRLKAVCENASGELERARKFKQELLTAPYDAEHVGMNRRLELLQDADRDLTDWTSLAGDPAKSCYEAKSIAAQLDLLPK